MVNGKLFNVYGETVMITFDEIKKVQYRFG